MDDCWEQLLISKETKTVDVIINAAVIEPIGTVGSIENSQLEGAIKVNYVSPVKLVNTLTIFYGHTLC